MKLVFAAVDTDTLSGAILEGLLKPALDDLDGLATTAGAETDDAGTTVAGNFTAGACFAKGLAGAGGVLATVLVPGLATALATALGTAGDAALDFGMATGLGCCVGVGLAKTLLATLAAGLETGLLTGLAGAVFWDDGATLAEGLATGLATGLVGLAVLATGLAAGLAMATVFAAAFATGLPGCLIIGFAAAFTGLLTTLAAGLAALAGTAFFFTTLDFFAGAFTSCLLTEPAAPRSTLRKHSLVYPDLYPFWASLPKQGRRGIVAT